jgi:hypothetical protein
MNQRPKTPLGLDVILETLAMRYEYDRAGRIIRVLSDGILPRFVLGRSQEGCVWRFGVGLEADRVKAIAKLAGREPGFTMTAEVLPTPPERLVMIERLVGPGGASCHTKHEVLEHDGNAIGELWTLA